jgi:hypothetical protein
MTVAPPWERYFFHKTCTDLNSGEKKGDAFSSLETSQNHLSNVLTLLMLMFSTNFLSDSIEIV